MSIIINLKKIWKDSVWSKIIATGILFLFTLAYNKFESHIQGISFEQAFIKFWNFPIKLWIFMVAVIVFALTGWIYVIIRQSRKFKYDENTLKLDSCLYLKIRDELLTDNMIMNAKQNVFSSNHFYGESLFNILDLTDESKKSYFEFLNPVLEDKKIQLIQTIEKLHAVTSNTVGGVSGTPGYLSIPREWAHNDRRRFDDAWKKISSAENELAQKYDDFIKTGKRILKV